MCSSANFVVIAAFSAGTKRQNLNQPVFANHTQFYVTVTQFHSLLVDGTYCTISEMRRVPIRVVIPVIGHTVTVVCCVTSICKFVC